VIRTRPRTATRLLLAAALASSLTLGTAVAAGASSAESTDHAVAAKKKKKAKATVKLATTSLGKVLVAANGRTLYLYDPDGTDTSASKCTGGCASAWPPLTTTKKLKAGKGLDASLLTTGGGDQVAYNGHLLYFFSGDSAAGQTNGQGVGGVWHAVDADGNTVT
jgi:predicted lipoprotein with Yx(FWY)xxD motif